MERRPTFLIKFLIGMTVLNLLRFILRSSVARILFVAVRGWCRSVLSGREKMGEKVVKFIILLIF